MRFYQFLPFLNENGIEVTVAPLLADEYIRRLYRREPQRPGFLLEAYLRRVRALLNARRYDLIWVEKEFLPFVPAVAQYFLKTPYVADYDDAAFHRYDMHSSPLVRYWLGGKIARVMRGAALVICGNEYLAGYARRSGARRVEILPTVIDTDRYEIRKDARPSGQFRIGWIGAPVTVNYLKAVEAALKNVLGEDENARLQIIGAPDPFSGRLPVELVPWEEETEVAALQQCDVGIMPLPDEPFERGKCGYKLIQYMGCGLPVVASPVGVNVQIVEKGINGYLAEKTEDWVGALTKLRLDARLRDRMGEAGRDKVVRSYSLHTAAPKLLSLLQSLKR